MTAIDLVVFLAWCAACGLVLLAIGYTLGTMRRPRRVAAPDPWAAFAIDRTNWQ